MKFLLVGAGAVGQSYGYLLARGGAEVSYLVKPQHAAAARGGFVLYPLRKKSRREPVRFDGFDAVTSASEAGARDWDAIVLCVSSTALRAGTWFAELAAAVDESTTIVTLQPGLEDYGFITETVAAERVVSGLIALASYHGPLPGESLPEPGCAFWIPPLARFPFSGERARVDAVVGAFRAGGLRAVRRDDVQRAAAFAVPLLQTQMLALECAGWSFAALRADRDLDRAAYRAMKQATAVVAREIDARPPLLQRWLRRSHISLLLRAAVRLAPMDLERFFEAHYTKVRDQSLDLIDTWIELAATHQLPAGALLELRDRLDALPAGAAKTTDAGSHPL